MLCYHVVVVHNQVKMEQLVTVNGKKYSFEVYIDLTEHCPECGVPACGKENYFWYKEDGLRKTLVLDGEILDLIINQFFTSKIKSLEYSTVSNFLRESNEGKGWSEADDFEGTPLDIDDLLKAVEQIEIEDLEEWMKPDGERYIYELKKISLLAKEHKKSLFVARN